MKHQAKKPLRTKAAALDNPPASGRIAVKVQPGASSDRLTGKTADTWNLAVTAPPVEGRANRACAEVLARRLGVPPSSVVIVRGASSRQKLIEVRGLSRSEIESRLQQALSRQDKP